jgi:chromosome segregation ATPase
MTSESPATRSFFSTIGNADATRRFIHDIAPAMAVDEGDYLTLATVTSGKNRKEATIGRLDRADEAGIVAFLQREVTSRGEGRYKVRYTGANGRRNGSRTFAYPVEQENPPTPVKAPMPLAQPPAPPARPPAPPPRQLPPRCPTPPPDRAELSPTSETIALEAKVKDLTTALTDLDSENAAVFQQLERERASLAELREEAIGLREQVDQAESIARHVDDERAALEQDRDRLQIQVDQAEATAQRAESDHAALQADRDQLQSRLHQAEADVAEQATRARKLKAQAQRAAADNADLQRQLAQERSRPSTPDQTSEIQSLQRRLKTVTGEREGLRQALDNHKQATATRLATCNKEIHMIEDDRLKLRQRLLQLEDENQKLLRQVRDLQDENARGARYIRRMRGDDDADDGEDDDNDGDEDSGSYLSYDFGEDDD